MISKTLILSLSSVLTFGQVSFNFCETDTYQVYPSIYLSRAHSTVYPQELTVESHIPMISFHLFVSQGPSDLKINEQIKTVTKCQGRGKLESYVYGSLRSIGNNQYWIDGIVRPFDFLQVGTCHVEFYIETAMDKDNYSIGCVRASNIVSKSE